MSAKKGSQEKDMKGKSVLITGANSGIGFVTASEMAARGAAANPGADIRVIDCDLGSLDSVKACAESFRKQKLPLHVLINNAGSSLYGATPFYTKEGVGGSAMINFLGAFALTRLLTPELEKSAPSRVVTVSSVMHRRGTLRFGSAPFLTDYEKGTYAHAKLAEVLFSYEYDRRASPRGIRAVAVDPGAVQTNIWDNTPLGHPIAKAVMDRLYAPPKEGARAVIHAATVPLEGLRSPSRGAAHRRSPAGGAFLLLLLLLLFLLLLSEPERLYFARGLFAKPPITADRWLPWPFWGLSTLAASVMDQPIRGLSRGLLLSRTAAVESSPESYDRKRAAELWTAAAVVAGLPEELMK